MTCHSSGVIVLERPPHLSEHAAGVVHQDVDAAGRRRRRGDERIHGAASLHVHADRVTRAASRTAQLLGLAQLVVDHVTCPDRAPRSANARLMARPNPCAAPVTMTVLPVKVEVHGWSARAGGRRERVERLERLRPRAALDLVDQLDQPRGERRGDAGLGAERHHDAELGVHLGGPLAHREIAPDAAVRLCRAAIVRDERVERALRRAGWRTREVGRRVEAVEGFGRDAASGGDGEDLARQGDVERPVLAASPGHRRSTRW